MTLSAVMQHLAVLDRAGIVRSAKAGQPGENVQPGDHTAARERDMVTCPAAKAQWFAGPRASHQLDFRVGGSELTRGRQADGPELTFASTYQEIRPAWLEQLTAHLSNHPPVD